MISKDYLLGIGHAIDKVKAKRVVLSDLRHSFMVWIIKFSVPNLKGFFLVKKKRKYPP
jgi:hypothetical protein